MSTIYLAGPIRHSDDPKTWREDVIEEYDHEFLNPLDWGSYEDEVAPSEVVTQDLHQINLNADAVLCRWENVPTAGTPMEIIYASEIYDIPVVVVPKDLHLELSPWVKEHADVVIAYTDYAMKFIEGIEYVSEN